MATVSKFCHKNASNDGSVKRSSNSKKVKVVAIKKITLIAGRRKICRTRTKASPREEKKDPDVRPCCNVQLPINSTNRLILAGTYCSRQGHYLDLSQLGQVAALAKDPSRGNARMRCFHSHTTFGACGSRKFPSTTLLHPFLMS